MSVLPELGDLLSEAPPTRSGEESQDALDLDALVGGIDALRRFLQDVAGHLPEQDLVRARGVIDRAGERLELSRDHTVVALVGTTGSGKSSMFNALAGLPLSPVGVLRPTTSLPHACTWGSNDAGPLLDWLGVPQNNRFDRESALDGDELAALRGLILLDLPDFDSVEGSHRDEVDRLLHLVDLVIWVLDPQKYADSVIHDQYLQPSAAHRDITLVALNQVDTLREGDIDQCVADLRRLLDVDGLTEVPLLPTSTVAERGLLQLRSALEAGVAAHEAYVWRLAADLKKTVTQLWPLVAVEPEGDVVDRGLVRSLVETLAAAAGVPAILDEIEREYLASATAATGWLVPRWLSEFRTNQVLRLAPAADLPEPAGGLPEQAAVQRASSALAARELAESAAKRLPQPWRIASAKAALASEDEIPTAIASGISKVDLAVTTQPKWWRTVGILQRVAITTAIVGLSWLLIGLVSASFGATVALNPRPLGFPVSAMLLTGGLALGLLLTAAVKPMIGFAARAARARARRRLHSAVAEVASDLVVAPVRRVLQAYSDARVALSRAR